MIYLLIALTWNMNFELGIVRNGSFELYNREYWSPYMHTIGGMERLQSSPTGLIYYTDIDIKFEHRKFFVSGGIKTYAERGNSYIFSPYRTQYDTELGYTFNDKIEIGFRHFCTHTEANFPTIFNGMYEELYIRFSK